MIVYITLYALESSALKVYMRKVMVFLRSGPCWLASKWEVEGGLCAQAGIRVDVRDRHWDQI